MPRKRISGFEEFISSIIICSSLVPNYQFQKPAIINFGKKVTRFLMANCKFSCEDPKKYTLNLFSSETFSIRSARSGQETLSGTEYPKNLSAQTIDMPSILTNSD